MSYINEWKLVSTYPLTTGQKEEIAKYISDDYITGNLTCDGQPENYMDTCIQYIKESLLINAVKTYKDATGCGLREAKDVIVKLRESLRKDGYEC